MLKDKKKIVKMLKKLKDDIQGNLGEFEKQKQILASQFKQCSRHQKQVLNKNKDLRDAVKNIGRKIASLKKDLRSNIANKLAKDV